MRLYVQLVLILVALVLSLGPFYSEAHTATRQLAAAVVLLAVAMLLGVSVALPLR